MAARREFLLSLRDSPAALPRVVLHVHQRGLRIERLSYRAAAGDTASLHLRVTGHESRLDSLGRQLARVVEVLRLRDGTSCTAYPVDDARSTVDPGEPVLDHPTSDPAPSAQDPAARPQPGT